MLFPSKKLLSPWQHLFFGVHQQNAFIALKYFVSHFMQLHLLTVSIDTQHGYPGAILSFGSSSSSIHLHNEALLRLGFLFTFAIILDIHAFMFKSSDDQRIPLCWFWPCYVVDIHSSSMKFAFHLSYCFLRLHHHNTDKLCSLCFGDVECVSEIITNSIYTSSEKHQFSTI